MLDPNYILHISEGAEDIAEQLHNDIIKRIIDRMMIRIGRGAEYLLTATDKWQMQTLQEAGYLLEDIQAEIAKRTRIQEQEIKEAMEAAGVKAISYDNAIYESIGLAPKPLEESPYLIRLMQRIYLATMGEWNNFTRTTADAAQQLFIRCVDRAYDLVMSGTLGYTEAVKEAVNSIVSGGVEVIYPSGHRDTIETATLRAVRTGVSQSTAEIQLARMEEMDMDKVIVSSHLGARPQHQVWQGKVFTVEQLRSTDEGMPAYGTVSGLCGANCRHNFSPYIEGMSNPFEQYDSEENLKMYEKEQRQRTLERRIRGTKREVLGLRESIDTCQDEYTKSQLELMYQKKAALLSKQNQAYKDFCKKNNMKELADRISIAKWDRKQAAKARGATQKYGNTKTKPNKGAHGMRGGFVQYDEQKDYTVGIPYYSDKVNDSLSESARKVATFGSNHKFEYSAIIDLDTGIEVDFGTSEECSCVSYYYKFLREHLDGRYVMVHNHNTHTQLSLPDMQELVMWENLDGIISVSNDGLICCAISNGKKSNEYLFSKYKEGNYGLDTSKSEIEQEIFMIDLAVKDFVKGGILLYGK